jgi:heat shock protein HslJ
VTRLTIFLGLWVVLSSPSILVAQDTPAEVKDLIGARASSGESELKKRGYTFVKTIEGTDRKWSTYWHNGNGVCITVATVQGRYEAITKSPPSDCNRNVSASGETTPELVQLRKSTWQWIRFVDPVQNFDVKNPDKYTLKFENDGGVAIGSDCNRARGSYVSGNAGSLEIKIGPVTRAMCLPESRSNEFLQNLGYVRHYFFRNDHLFMDLMADEGTFEFTRIDSSGSEANVDDRTFRNRIEVVDSLFGRAQKGRAANQLNASEYRSIIKLLHDEELSIYEAVRKHRFSDITEESYWSRGRLKFPSALDHEYSQVR